MKSTYGRLCDATADELFDSDKAGLPVYTLPEGDALARIVKSAGLDPSDAHAEFCRVVRSTLYLDAQGQSPLRWHTEATKRYLSLTPPLETPPSLPLLVVFTLAAEAMQADTNMAANNFYGRVRPLLCVPHEREYLFIGAYQKHADLLWRSLNVWLEAWEGERGAPTAYSLGRMRHIGLPMSQAVVRQHDRVGLIEAFEDEALPPGFRMSPEDMELTLDAYATTRPSPLSNNLRRLWSNQDARARIVQAACLELESWTGAAERESVARTSGSARLIAYVRTFLRTVIELNLAIATDGQNASEVVFRSSRGEVTLPAVVSSPGSARLASMDAVSPQSLVAETLSGWIAGNEQSKFIRRPRRVVPLRWDELQGCYIEVERVSVGEENLVLARADTHEQVKQLLGSCARPGWSLLQEAAGLPNEWVLFRRVQVVSVPEKATHVDLTPLVPRSRTSLTMRGGFDLPGRLRKWSSLQPPEVIAYAVGARSVAIRVFQGDRVSDQAERVSIESEGELAILTLSNYELSDGEYFASMFVDGDKRPRSGSVIRLRSADTPLFRVEEADTYLVYSPASGARWPLTAGPANWSDYVNGARVVGEATGVRASRPMREYTPREQKARPHAGQSRIHVGNTFAPDSCMVTGGHRFQLPPALGGRPTSATIEGECTTCGLVKRFAATPWAAARKKNRTQTAHQVIELPPIEGSVELDQRVLFDAICHVGHGSYRDLERIAGNVDGSGLYADNFLRVNEVLGHIDVSRDEYLRVSGWAVNAPTIAPVGDGGWVLVGSRSRGMLNALRGYFGVEAVVEHQDRGALRVTVAVEVDALHSRLDELASLGIQVRETSPALDIAYTLPALSQIERGLKRISIPSYRSLEKWDTQSAAWMPSDSLASLGAYRLREFQSLYVVRSDQDIQSGTAAVGTAQLVKHIANSWAGDPLAGYHTRTGSVLTPLGADLPALYGRALALCCGMAPLEHSKSRLVQYPDVPRTVADVIFDRLTT
jgi:hypothetical protein